MGQQTETDPDLRLMFQKRNKMGHPEMRLGREYTQGNKGKPGREKWLLMLKNPHFQTLFFLGICTQRTGQPVSEEVAQTVGRYAAKAGIMGKEASSRL